MIAESAQQISLGKNPQLIPASPCSEYRTLLPASARPFRFLLLALACCSVSVDAAATLGKPQEQIAKVAAGLRLEKVGTQSGRGYILRTLSSPELTVKEYVNPKTKLVFGVTWRGTRMPDLKLLLGFDPATLKEKGAYQPLHQSTIETPTLLLERVGRVGFYAGRAIRLDLLPSGVERQEVKP